MNSWRRDGESNRGSHERVGLERGVPHTPSQRGEQAPGGRGNEARDDNGRTGRVPRGSDKSFRSPFQIERKRRQQTSLKSQLESTLERLGEIRRHTANVRQEQRQNQQLLRAKSSQLETENHLYKVAQVEESRLQRETKQSEKETRDSGEKIEKLEENLERLSKKLEASRKSIELEQNRLKGWEEKLNKKEEKNTVIEHFVKSDEKTFKVPIARATRNVFQTILKILIHFRGSFPEFFYFYKFQTISFEEF